MDARAQSIPVVASNIGGIPTSVEDKVDGLLVPPKDADALAEAIHAIMADHDLRQALIRNGLATAHKHTISQFVKTALEAL